MYLDWSVTNLALIFVACQLVTWCIYLWLRTQSKTQWNLPPGPWWNLPLVGYLPFLGTDYIKGFQKLQDKYGPIFRLKLGTRSVVVINDYYLIKEAFGKNAFLGRPPSPPNQLLKGATSFSAKSGAIWNEQRRFTMHVLRDLGFGKTKMEIHIEDEIQELLSEIKSFEGRPIAFRDYLSPSISNNICALVIGRRMDFDDPKKKLFDHVITELVRFFRPTSVHAWYPWLRKFLSKVKFWEYDKLAVAVDEVMDFVREEIEKHHNTLDSNNIRDYIDAFLQQMEQAKLNNSNTTSFTKSMLIGNIPSLLTGGITNIRSTIEWTLLAMAEYPEVQNRMLKELDDCVGRDRLPNWTDSNNLPYINAVLLEILRWKTVVPINMLRYTTEDTSVGGYDIPKATTVMANFHAVHNDTNYWNEPHVFKPERFLSKDDKKLVRRDNWIAFSIGRRNCPGETLAQVEILLYVCTLLQKFEIRYPDGEKHNFGGTLSIHFAPYPYKLCFVARK